MIKNFKRTIRVANIIEEGRLGGPQTRMTLIASALEKSEFNSKIDVTFILPKKDQMILENSAKGLVLNIFYFHLQKLLEIG